MSKSKSPVVIKQSKRRAFIGVGAIAGAVAAAGMVVNTSHAAFTASSENANNSFTAGTLALTDDDSTSQMFSVGGLVPGQTETKCIQVTYTGTASSVTPIKLYSTLNSSTLNLPDYLQVTVEQGAGGTFNDCTNFTPTTTPLISSQTLRSVTSSYTNYANGVGSFTPPTSPATVSYRFTVKLDTATPNSVQGGTANASFFWEIQSA